MVPARRVEERALERLVPVDGALVGLAQAANGRDKDRRDVVVQLAAVDAEVVLNAIAGVVIAVLLLGVYLVIGAGSIAIPGSSNTVGPRFFPYLVGAATILVGGVLALRVLRGDQGPEEAGEDVEAKRGRPVWEMTVPEARAGMRALRVDSVRPQDVVRVGAVVDEVADGLPVRVTWVENDGRSTSRDLAPLDLSAGLVRAVDRTNAQIVTIALSRIAAVDPV